MDIRNILAQRYPENSKQGQCFQFLHKLATFPSVGDTLAEKLKAVANYGIPMALFNGNYRLGDIIVTNESLSTGHGAMVNKLVGQALQLTECNYHLDEKVHHTRQLPVNSPKIVGVIRPDVFSFPFPPVQYPILITCKILMNNQPPWNKTILSRMAELQNWYWENSGQKIQLVIDLQDVKFPSFPLVVTGGAIDGEMVDIIEENWYNQNILPVSNANINIIVIRKQDWKGRVQSNSKMMELGYCYEPHYPIKIWIVADEMDNYAPDIPGLWGFSKIAAHEISHGLYGVCGNNKIPAQSDLTHNHFYGINGYPFKPTDIFKDLDYSALNAKINP